MKTFLKDLGSFLALAIVIALGVAVGTVYVLPVLQGQKVVTLGDAFDDRAEFTLIGSSSNLVSLPVSAVFANSTTTDPAGRTGSAGAFEGLEDGGDVLSQRFDTSGVRKVLLHISAIGGTNTSTLYVRQMGSFDETNYFDIGPATSTVSVVGTTTLVFFPKATQFDPGSIATTSLSIPFDIDGYRDVRFIIYGENAASDPSDGVQAWITMTKVEDKR